MITQELNTEQTPELNKALYETAKVFVQPVKNKEAHYGKYADLSAIDSAIRKAIKKADSGLSFYQGILDNQTANGGKDSCKIYTTIRHISGESLTIYGDSFPRDAKMQTQGANETYAKRTSLCLAFGVVADDDDDGQSVALLDDYKAKQEEARERVAKWITSEFMNLKKDEIDKLRLVLKHKDKKPADLTYAEVFQLAGALNFYKLQQGQFEEK
ncbi:ERF family protein [Latilactobacillus sakei]|uniref:ERF family protein n=1 Tax=Latilactobacillus sakei TaxID=1599 RepID=UPI0020C7FEA4|nr:ERF family protein [Latilactobacillus sakei]MCP8855958.1 ERF family protein [Latilactobacillus sakei]